MLSVDRVVALLAILLGVAVAAWPQEDLTVPLPPGETLLDDIGLYQVGYQSYAGPEVLMPVSWTGHFVDPSGISYDPNRPANGRRGILLHSPWRLPPGRAWVDYHLRLPDIKPITLSFGIAMLEEVTAPGKSDGVTFSVYLTQGGQTDELLREHYAGAEWRDQVFELSELAGEDIVLRLQVEPGPDNDPSFDYSFFGNARLAAGDASGGRKAVLQELLSSKAYEACRGANLTALANRSDQGVIPSNLLPCRNTLERPAGGFAFIYEGADARIIYRYQPATGTLDDLTVSVDDGHPFRPAAGGVVIAAVQADGKEEQVPLTAGRLVDVTAGDGNGVECTYEYDAKGQPVRVTWRFGIKGKALTVGVTCDTPILSRLSLGGVSGAALRRNLSIPYLPPVWGGGGAVNYLPADNVFVSRYLDWTHSAASSCPQGEATYEPKTDGTRNPLHEFGYVAVSPNVNEVLPNVPWEPSPYLTLLGDRIMLDIWGHHNNSYVGDAENLRELKDNGVDHLAIIQHVWQRWGYDVKLPDHIPANPDYGGDEGMIEFGRTANGCGYVWSVHENYIDLYPDAPSYDPAARVLRADGTPSPAWFNRDTGVQSFGLKCNRALGYAQQNSPYIHDTYKTTAAYLDVHTCVPPWHQLDHEADQPGAAMARTKVQLDGELFQYMRDTHGGPLFGEGANHFYWAGKCDGVEAQVNGGEDHEPFLDLDMLKLHPQMVNHGMGYYERWFRQGYDHSLGVNTGTPEQIDKYRAQELAYGHAGFIGSSQTDNIQWVAKEHHLMHPVQRLYGAAKVTDLSYEVDGQMVPGSIALAMGETRRQRVTYDSGLTLWVNWRPEPWRVERGAVLPQWGFLATGPETRVYTALKGEHFADYAECPEFLFADARTSFNMPYRTHRKNISPRLKDFAYLGGNRVRLTYEWDINDSMDFDAGCFVHFVNLAKDHLEKIVFQQDHQTPIPASQWRPGQVLLDGPYEIEVPPDFDDYYITIGLWRGERVLLKGPRMGNNRVVIGQLKLTKKDGVITDIALGDISQVEAEAARAEADFSAHMNPPGTMVDFGKIATDGSIKVNLGERSLTVFPYPREREFTVRLDLKAIAPGASIADAAVKVEARATGDQAPMGEVAAAVRNGAVTFRAGQPGAGRYVVNW